MSNKSKRRKMSFHIQHDWLPLVGEVVEVRLHNEFVRYGVVDAVTNDNSILWLAVDGVNTRTMVERAEGYEIWIDYKWERPSRVPGMGVFPLTCLATPVVLGPREGTRRSDQPV
ncbi:hypothetical protein [Paenarthrobacter sp. NPDC058040]|uniref:hypothetical protein n=1 Tax=unclassified Paenarthrobacter TaxID=2634190 RepID=UPI0036D941F2